MESCAVFGANVRKLDPKKRLLRIVLMLIVPGVQFMAFTLAFMLFVSSSATYLRYFIQMSLASALAGYLLIKMPPILLKKYQLDVCGDFMQLSDSPSTHTTQSSYENDYTASSKQIHK